MDMGRAPKPRKWQEKYEDLSYGSFVKGSEEDTPNANFMGVISYDKGIVLCEQYWGSVTEEKFAQIVQSELP